WMQATMAGLEVQGYHPREIDRARREERTGETHARQPAEPAEPVAPRDGSTSRSEKAQDELTVAHNLAITTLQTILRERGDALALIQRAHERVVKNEAGEVMGRVPQPAKRNRWDVLSLQTLGIKERDRVIAATRVSTHEPVVQVFDQAAARTTHAPEAGRLH